VVAGGVVAGVDGVEVAGPNKSFCGGVVEAGVSVVGGVAPGALVVAGSVAFGAAVVVGAAVAPGAAVAGAVVSKMASNDRRSLGRVVPAGVSLGVIVG
jgi:hypothetical protein